MGHPRAILIAVKFTDLIKDIEGKSIRESWTSSVI